MKTKSPVFGSLLGTMLVLSAASAVCADQIELSSEAEGRYSATMPQEGENTITVPADAKVIRIHTGSQVTNSSVTLTAPEGKILQVIEGDYGSLSTEYYDGFSGQDSLFVYNGANASAPEIFKASRGTALGTLSTTGPDLTIYYKEVEQKISWYSSFRLDLIVFVVDPNALHNIEVDEYAASNGSVTVQSYATANTLVQVEAVPNEGYVLEGFVVRTTDEWFSIATIENVLFAGNEATFIMPGTNVTVEPIFVSTADLQSGLTLNTPGGRALRVNIPSGVESFNINGGGMDNELNKPMILKAPDGYLFYLEEGSAQYGNRTGIFAYDGDNEDAYRTRMEPMAGKVSAGSDLTLVYVSIGDQYERTIRLIEANATHNVDVHYSGNGYAGGDLSSASTGNTINLTATPDEGYMIGSIYAEAYFEDDSWSLPVVGGTWYTSNDYSFTMPYADVRVNVEFVGKKTTANEGLSIEMPQRDTVFATIPADVESFNVNGECVLETCNGTLVLAAPEGLKFQLTGDVKTYGDGAGMAVFDGSGTGATKIWDLNQGNDIYLNSSGDTLTLHYESSDSYMKMNLRATVVDPNKKYKIEVASLQCGTIDGYPESAAPGDTVTMNITTDIKSYNVCVEAYDLKTTFYEFYRCYRSAWYENQVQFVMPEKDLSLEVYIFEAEYGDAVIPRADTLRLDIPEGMKSIDIYSDYSYIDWLYYSNSDGVLVLTAPEGYKLVVAEGAGDISDEGDSLIIYAGDGVDAERELATISVGGEIGELENTGRSLTFKFKSDGEGNGEGVYANVRVVDVNEVYSITLAGTWNGNMISDKLSATVGDTVTLVATPDEGYLLNYFTVDWEDFHGSWNSISPVGGTWYSGNEAKFVMPRGDVLIYAEFRSPNDYLRATIPTTDTVVANIPEGIRKLTVRTACGWAYCNNSDGVLVLTAPEGYSLRVSGSTDLVDEDSVFIYDGMDTDAKVLAKMSNNNNHIDYIYSTGRSLAFRLKSNDDGFGEYPELNVDVLKKSGSSAVAVYEYYNGYKFARIDGLYDGKDTVNIEEDIEVSDVEFIRNFAVTANDSGKYSTIVFPFDFNASSVSGLDDILEFSQMTEENGKLQVEMNRVWCRADVDPDRDCSSYEGNLKANTPYMLKMTDETLFFNGSDYTIKKTEPAVATSGNWQFIGTYAYKKWEKGDTDLGSVYGFAATASNGAEIGQFVKAGSGAFIRPMRAYLKHSSSNAEPRPAPAGHVSVWRDRSNELPEEIEVVVVEGKGRAGIGSGESGSEKTTTVIGRINTRTGEFTPVTRTYDLKGRSLNAKPKAKGVYVGKKR